MSWWCRRRSISGWRTARSCGSTPRWCRPTSTIRPTARCCGMPCASCRRLLGRLGKLLRAAYRGLPQPHARGPPAHAGDPAHERPQRRRPADRQVPPSSSPSPKRSWPVPARRSQQTRNAPRQDFARRPGDRRRYAKRSTTIAGWAIASSTRRAAACSKASKSPTAEKIYSIFEPPHRPDQARQGAERRSSSATRSFLPKAPAA